MENRPQVYSPPLHRKQNPAWSPYSYFRSLFELDALESRTWPLRDTSRGILALRRYELRNAILENTQHGPGFPYSRKLESHSSCVNALAFSSGNGQFLASGGDDLRICLWDFHQMDVKKPSFTLRGPKGHIYCIKFSTGNRFLYAAGTCNTIFKYDISYLGLNGRHMDDRYPNHAYHDNTDSIRDLACHPMQDEVFISVSEDGTIRRYDGRQPRRSSALDVLQTNSEVSGVQYHPILEQFFITSDTIGRVVLRDARMAFSPRTSRSGEGIVQKYNTKLSKRTVPHLCNPEASSVSFDRDGAKLAVSFLHYLPTIYAFSDSDPIAVLSGRNLPDGTPNPPNEGTYCNSCTMKHGSFGGPGLGLDDMYAGGSDDFRCYIWKIPSVSQLINQRQIIEADNWKASHGEGTIAFSESFAGQKVVPVEISTPFCRLTGHDSIVNTALFHPHLFHVVTAGVEKKVVLHSSTQFSPCTQDLQLSPLSVRKLDDEESERDRINFFSTLESEGLQPVDITDDNDERQTLSLFDHIIREEGETDVFQLRAWGPQDSSDEANGDSDSDTLLDDGGTFPTRSTSFFTY